MLVDRHYARNHITASNFTYEHDNETQNDLVGIRRDYHNMIVIQRA